MATFLKYLIIAAVAASAWVKHDEINATLRGAWQRAEVFLGINVPVEANPQPIAQTHYVHQPVQIWQPPPPTSAEPEVSQPPPQLPQAVLPEGVYLVSERIPVTTDAGVRAVTAGTLVELVHRETDHWIVRDEVGEFTVKPSQVTRDETMIAKEPLPVASMPPKAVGNGVGSSYDPYASIRRTYTDRILGYQDELRREVSQLNEFKLRNPSAVSLGRVQSPEVQRRLAQIARLEKNIGSYQRKLKALPPPPK